MTLLHSKRKSVLASNSLWNLAGLVIPLLVGLVTVPIIVKAIGPDRFGLLSLSWVVVGYFCLLDFGMGRALTQQASVAKGLGEEDRIPELFWTALTLAGILGTIGGFCFWFFGSRCSASLLPVSQSLRAELSTTILVIAVTIPAVTTTTVLRGLLETYSRFRILSLIRGTTGVLMFLGPAILQHWYRDLGRHVLLLSVIRWLGCLVQFWICTAAPPLFYHGIRVRIKAARLLITLGGWMTVSNIISPVMVAMDRFVVASSLSTYALALYTAPSEICTKVLLLPSALVGVLFPSLSEVNGRSRGDGLQLYERSVSMIAALTYPPVLFLICFAHPLLKGWLGVTFAQGGYRVMQILCIGVFLNALAQAPVTLIHSVGRPNWTARLHIVELVLYLIGLFAVVKFWGIIGVAFLWSARMLADALALWLIARTITTIGRTTTEGIILAVGLLIGAITLSTTTHPFSLPIVVFVVALLIMSRYHRPSYEILVHLLSTHLALTRAKRRRRPDSGAGSHQQQYPIVGTAQCTKPTPATPVSVKSLEV